MTCIRPAKPLWRVEFVGLDSTWQDDGVFMLEFDARVHAESLDTDGQLCRIVRPDETCYVWPPLGGG